jgi:hypothetical protein
MMQQLNLFEEQIPVEAPQKLERSVNPCLALYGPGPEGEICKDCAYLVGRCLSKVIYKCCLRENTCSQKTDHRLRWPACAKFQKREGEIKLYDGRR